MAARWRGAAAQPGRPSLGLAAEAWAKTNQSWAASRVRGHGRRDVRQQQVSQVSGVVLSTWCLQFTASLIHHNRQYIFIYLQFIHALLLEIKLIKWQMGWKWFIFDNNRLNLHYSAFLISHLILANLKYDHFPIVLLILHRMHLLLTKPLIINQWINRLCVFFNDNNNNAIYISVPFKTLVSPYDKTRVAIKLK